MMRAGPLPNEKDGAEVLCECVCGPHMERLPERDSPAAEGEAESADAEVRGRPAALLSAPRDASEVDDFIASATAPGAAAMNGRRAAREVLSRKTTDRGRSVESGALPAASERERKVSTHKK